MPRIASFGAGCDAAVDTSYAAMIQITTLRCNWVILFDHPTLGRAGTKPTTLNRDASINGSAINQRPLELAPLTSPQSPSATSGTRE